MGRSDRWTSDLTGNLQNPCFFITTLPRPEHRGSTLSSKETGSIQAGFSLRKTAISPKRGPHRGFPQHFSQKTLKPAGPVLMKSDDPGLLQARMDRSGGAGLHSWRSPKVATVTERGASTANPPPPTRLRSGANGPPLLISSGGSAISLLRLHVPNEMDGGRGVDG